MQKAVITICGLIGHQKQNDDKTAFVDKLESDKAIYNTDGTLTSILNFKDKRYINMLPLLIKEIDGYKQVAIATNLAKNIQEKVLQFENIDLGVVDFVSISDEKDYAQIFGIISSEISKYDEVIIDLSHGFRYLPILAIIALIVQNIDDKQKIKHILFAKEIKKDKQYHIIDLSEYLDIATVSYALASFDTNYTIANIDVLRTEKFKPLLSALSSFGEHILGNSLKAIFSYLVQDTIRQLEDLQNDDMLKPMATRLSDTIEHLKIIYELNKLPEYEKLFRLGQIMLERKYLLNAITLLVESAGYYTFYALRLNANSHLKTVLNIAHNTASQENSSFHTYHLVGSTLSFFVNKLDAKNFLKPQGNRLNLDITLVQEAERNAKSISGSICKERKRQFKKLYEDISNVRNNLAHANSSNQIKDIAKDLQAIYLEYENLCIKQDIFFANGGLVFGKVGTMPKVEVKAVAVATQYANYENKKLLILKSEILKENIGAEHICNTFVSYMREYTMQKLNLETPLGIKNLKDEAWKQISQCNFSFITHLSLKTAFEALVSTNKNELLSFAVPFAKFYKLHLQRNFNEAKVIALDFVNSTN